MPIETASRLTTRSCARNSPMHTSAAGDAAPPSRVAKLVTGAGKVTPLRPTQSPASGASRSGLVSKERTTLAPVDQKLLYFLQIDFDHDDREQEQDAGGEQGGDDRGRRAVWSEHQEAHRNAHEADIAVAGVQPFDAGIGDATAARAVEANAAAKVTANPPQTEATKPNWRT